MWSMQLVLSIGALLAGHGVHGWAGQSAGGGIKNNKVADPVFSRRQAFAGAAMGFLAGAVPAMADTGAEVRGTAVTPFNGLIFNYRGSDSDVGGLKATDLNEPSISYGDFVSKLKSGDVKFVEFMAPDGDAAYATIEGLDKPIRIGEGYPTEQHDGWSSPAFAVRTVKNYNVPYKFTVPALASYKSS